MNIKQYIKLPKSSRQSHINLQEDCIPAICSDKRKSHFGSPVTRATGMTHAKNALLDFLSLLPFTGRNIHTCHVCSNNSQLPNGFVCKNPKHIYFGTAKENIDDIPISDKGNAYKSTMKNNNHMNQRVRKCQWCDKVSNLGAIANHEKYCKHKS